MKILVELLFTKPVGAVFKTRQKDAEKGKEGDKKGK